MSLTDRLFSFLGSTIKIVIITIGSLDGNGSKEESDSLKTEYREEPISSDVMDQNDVMTGEDFTTVDAATRGNKDAALDVPFDEQSTVVFGE